VRIQVASDLHLEFLQRSFPDYRVIEPADADVLVLAGDIHSSGTALEVFADWPVPVVCIAGNHEFYHGDSASLERAFAAGPIRGQVHVLERRAWIYRDVRVLGTTLWTDYALYGNAESAMSHAAAVLMDHKAIRNGNGAFTPADALDMHRRSRDWLGDMLARPFDGPTVVCTHHAPHPGSIHAMYEDNPANPGFINDLSNLLTAADLWIHGHVHNSFDYCVGSCRVVANPRGYALNRRAAWRVGDLDWENPRFDPRLVVEV
jgi:predicted phosphodiesterase